MSEALIGIQFCAGEFNSGEIMLAGAGCIVGDRTPAKPLWSEVIVRIFCFDRSELYQKRVDNTVEKI